MSFSKHCKVITKTDIDYTMRSIGGYIQVGRCLACKKMKRNFITEEELLIELNKEKKKLKKYEKPTN